MKRSVLSLVLAWIGAATLASAALIANESFDTSAVADVNNGIYANDTVIRSTTVTGGSIIGFGANAWNNGSNLFKTDNGALHYLATISHVDGQVRAVRRSLETPVSGNTTYYVSMRLSSEIIEATGSAYAGFNTGENAYAAGNVFGIFLGFAGNGEGMDLVLRQRENLGGGTYGLTNRVIASTATGAVYNVVAKIEVNASNDDELVTVWLNPTSESDTAVFSSLHAASFPGNGQGITVMSFSAKDFGGTVSFDEMRLGTAWADVVPEPHSIGLFLIGSSSFFYIRSRGHRK